MFAIGDQAPGFTLPDSAGEDFSLATHRGKQHVLLIFYPQDFTSG